MASTRSVRICGIAFALIFTAYNTAQNYMTTLLGAKLGSAVLVCVYGGLIVVTPLAPAAAPSLGIAPTLAAGGLTYAGLMGALLIRAVGWLPDALSTALVLIAATLNGCGGAMLWSAQGSLVILETRPEASDGGRQSGDFWALFHLSTICGNALAFWGFTEGGSPALLFGLFLAIALLGVGLADTARHQTAAVAARVIAGAPLQTAVHHHGDAFDGDTGLRHIGGQHHPRPGRRFQHRRLGIAGQAPVQHLHRHRHRQPLAQPLDLAHPGQEHQHRALPGQRLHLAGAVIPDILIAARRRMAHLHRKHPPLTAHRGQ